MHRQCDHQRKTDLTYQLKINSTDKKKSVSDIIFLSIDLICGFSCQISRARSQVKIFPRCQIPARLAVWHSFRDLDRLKVT